MMPKNADRMPWRLNQDYLADRADMKSGAIDDGVLAFRKAGAPITAAVPELLDAAE
jgi:monooxygenase